MSRANDARQHSLTQRKRHASQPNRELRSQLPPRTGDEAAAPRAVNSPPPSKSAADGLRLQKVMANAGVGSRRHCEELITAGRVEVDGRVVAELGTKVRAEQSVRVDGVALNRARPVYYLVNKPAGVVSTNHDPSGRTRVIDLLPPSEERLFTVGRLDMSSEGLILLTNDGELANLLAHPRYGVEKVYQVLIAGIADAEVLTSLRRGVHLAEGVARAADARIKKTIKQSTLLEIVLKEGKNREIRRMLARLGHKVLRLRRVAMANLRIGDLPPGDFRRLTQEEVKALRRYRPGRVSASGRRELPSKRSRPRTNERKPPAGPAGSERAARPTAGADDRTPVVRRGKPRWRKSSSERVAGRGDRPAAQGGTSVRARPPRKERRR